MTGAPAVIGVDEARSFLAAHFVGSVDGVELVGEGAWSRCFGFRHAGDELVVRFGNHVEDFEKDRRAETFRGPLLPIPTVVEIGPAFDGWFALSTRVHGEPLEQLDAADWEATLPSLFAALDAMRSIDISDTTGWGLWGRDGSAPSATWLDFLVGAATDTPAKRTHGWRSKLAASAVGDGVFRHGIPLLAELAAAASTERSLVHGDLVNRNVLVAGGHITGVLDWGCSLLGDFLYELALLAFWSPWHAGIASTDVVALYRKHLELTGVAVPEFEARLRACLLHVGLDHHAWCVTIGDEASLLRINQQTRALIDG